MTTTINASTTAGLVNTADTSGVLALQTAGTTAISIDASQNVNFAGTAQRITGDFSNATVANRLIFQTSTVNAGTNISFIPSGTNTNASLQIHNNSDTTNYSFAHIIGNASEVRFASNIAGTGTYLPMTFYTGGSERMRINSGAPILCLAGGSTTATGTGIAFPATVSLSSDANTLDDYEEGTWTPSLGGNTTYTGRTGTYTKIGNTVRVYLEVIVNLIGTGSATTVSGFPFSPSGNDAGCVSYFDTLNASVYWLTIQMQSGGNCVFAGTTAATATIVNGVSIFRNGARIIGTVVYQTSS